MTQLILVTGVTGYVGGRLVPRLLAYGYRVRCLARDPLRLQGRPWQDQVEVVAGDVLSPETLPAAFEGVSAAYYLIHGMAQGEDFAIRDKTAALNFATAAYKAAVARIIYLGGLGDAAQHLSQHLQSRHETGTALRASGVPVTEFRAAVVVGSGSLSFEMIRYLTERLPVMICPRWVSSRIQPIAIRNVLDYLVAALENPQCAGRVIEIGGADVLTYADMMKRYAKVRGLRRALISVPVLTPRLSSYWIRIVTPLPVAIARPLIDGLHNDVIVRDPAPAQQLFPQVLPMGYDEAVTLALAKLKANEVETAWHDSMYTSQRDTSPAFLTVQEGIIVENRQLVIHASPQQVFAAFTSLGGSKGWPSMNWAWRLRGAIDSCVGGVGMRRGRRHPANLRVGEALDFWRVEAIEPGRLMRLRAEMKLPGKAWLQFRVEPRGNGESLLNQTAYFAPKGLTGHLYWYGLYPVHRVLFSKMIQEIEKLACAKC